MVLQYRQGGNRPITRRLLICWAQTAAVLPPMRNPPGLYSEYIYASRILDRGFDPPGLTLGYSIGHGLLHSFSCSYSARVALLFLPTPRCSDKTFLNWVSSAGDVSSTLLEVLGFFHSSDYLLIFVLSYKTHQVSTKIQCVYIHKTLLLMIISYSTSNAIYIYACVHILINAFSAWKVSFEINRNSRTCARIIIYSMFQSTESQYLI